MTIAITQFEGPYRFLSNFHPCPVGIGYDGDVYPTVEHAFQASKTLDRAERAHVRSSAYPGQAKLRGRKVTLRPAWENIKLSIMYDLVLCKFVNDVKLQQLLLATGDRELIEGNTWGDKFWGTCDGVGENHLGKILMQVRAEILEATA